MVSPVLTKSESSIAHKVPTSRVLFCFILTFIKIAEIKAVCSSMHYHPPYEREIWHYEKANVDHIRRSIDEFSWERCFANISVNNKVHMFNKTIKNIMSNYIPHETIICDGRDPPWINKDIKELIFDKNHVYKSYIRNDKSLQSKSNSISVSSIKVELFN